MASTEVLVNEIVSRLDKIQAERKKKLEIFKSLLRDPDIALVLSEALRTGDLGSGQVVSVDLDRESEGQGQRRQRQQGLRESIRQLAGQLPERFTIDEVTEKLKDQRFSFKRSDPEKSVRDALYKLQDGTLRVVEEGKGGKPNVYEFVKKPGKSPTG